MNNSNITYTVYSKDACPACVNAKRLLSDKNFSYKDIKIVTQVKDLETEISREDFFEKYPGVRSVPYIIDSQNNIYKTYNELYDALLQCDN